MHKDDDTLIVSQHIPMEFDGESDIFGDFKDNLFQNKANVDPEKQMISQTHFNKYKDGSLLDLFESPHMTVHMII